MVGIPAIFEPGTFQIRVASVSASANLFVYITVRLHLDFCCLRSGRFLQGQSSGAWSPFLLESVMLQHKESLTSGGCTELIYSPCPHACAGAWPGLSYCWMLSCSQNTGRNMASLLCETSDESSSFQAWRRLLCTPQTVNIKLQIITTVQQFLIQTFFCQSNIFAWTVDG